MRRLAAIGGASAVLILGLAPAASAAPTEFGTKWDDPRTAGPAVAVPPGRSCTVRIVDNKFVNFDTYRNTYTPPAACAGSWSKVVLTMHGAVQGRQFDRLGFMTIGDVTVFKTSTPEPSVEGIHWTVQKDVTSYTALLTSTQPVTMFLGNVVNDTYTGILDIQVDLTFYPGRAPDGLASDVIPLAGVQSQGTDRTGTLTVPRNTERLLAEVYASGSGGGCEEFWYLTAPPASGYSCQADTGPYREVQVIVDGQVAGIAAPYPHIYTGGWSNPFLWYVLPAPRAFDLHAISYDLSPYVGQLTDGRAHTVTIRVVGVPAGQPGWDVPTSFLAWRDRGSTQVTGALLHAEVTDLANESTYTKTDGWNQVRTTGGHRARALGFVNTSHGRVTTLVDRKVDNDSTHRWQDGENPDNLVATWTDESTVIVAGRHPALTRVAARYTIDGGISVDAADRLTTTIKVTDAAQSARIGAGRPSWSTLDDTYTGTASWTLNVARPDRHAVGTSQERYQLHGDTCYDHTIATSNGFITTDTRAC